MYCSRSILEQVLLRKFLKKQTFVELNVILLHVSGISATDARMVSRGDFDNVEENAEPT